MVGVGNRSSSDNEIPITSSLENTSMQPARFLFDRFAGDRNLVHRFKPGGYRRLFLPRILVPCEKRRFDSFFFFFFFLRISILLYLEGIILLFSLEEKKIRSFLVFPSRFSMMKFALGIFANQLGCCSRRVIELKSDLSPTLFLLRHRYRRFLRLVTAAAAIHSSSSSSPRIIFLPPLRLIDFLHPS